MVLVDQAVEDRLPPDGADVGQIGDRPRDRGRGLGRSLTAGLMRTMNVIVRGVFGEDLGQLLSLTISIQSRTSRRSVLTTRSQIAFARGACGGVLMIRIPSAWKTLSKVAMNLVSRSRSKNRSASIRVPSFIARFRAC